MTFSMPLLLYRKYVYDGVVAANKKKWIWHHMYDCREKKDKPEYDMIDMNESDEWIWYDCWIDKMNDHDILYMTVEMIVYDMMYKIDNKMNMVGIAWKK